jgi:N-sulfoglucosamine sulfohydrolase
MKLQRCNILYLHSHDTGRFIQPYGYAVATPQLQRFAEQGVLFRQAFCAGPTCSPSRAALLTGMYPHSNGMLGLAHRGSRLNDYSRHLSSFLKEHGYATALFGIQHEAHGELVNELGYDAMNTDAIPDAVVRNATAFMEQPLSRPFFMSCGFFLTHRTGRGIQWHNDGDSPTGDPRYVRAPAPLPDTPEVRRDIADFAVAAGRLDTAIGAILDALDKNGLAENTLVIITTDHGIAFPRMKCNLTDHGTGVMLMLRGPAFAEATAGNPGGFTGGKVLDALVSHVDIFPTLCEVIGLPKPDWLQGRSLLPLLNGEASIRDEVFSEVNWHAAVEPMRAVRTARYKYIRRYNPETGLVRPNCDDSVSKNELVAAGWNKRSLPAEEFYDLLFDPSEAHSRVDDPGYAAEVADLRERLDRWMLETNDPLLTDRLEPWPGMVINQPDGESPQDPVLPAAPFCAMDGFRKERKL